MYSCQHFGCYVSTTFPLWDNRLPSKAVVWIPTLMHIEMFWFKNNNVHFFPGEYLVGAPVPQRRDGHAEDDARPGQVRGHRVSEQVESVIAGDAAGGVRHADRWYRFAVPLHQSLPASHFGKALKGRHG